MYVKLSEPGMESQSNDSANMWNINIILVEAERGGQGLGNGKYLTKA